MGPDAARTGVRYSRLMERREHRFVVHIWFETGGRSDGQWRGAVEHLGNDRRLYFSSLGDLTDFIKVRIGETPVPAGDRNQET